MSRGSIDWSMLPSDLLEKIAGTLDEIADRIRFGAVCRPWRSASRSTHLPRVRLPWLLLEDIDDEEVRSFFALSDNKIHTLHLPETRRRNLYCSAYGWLLTAGYEKSFSLLNPITRTYISLLNPIIRTQISLPPLNDRTGHLKLIATPEALVVMVSSDSYYLNQIYCYRRLQGLDSEAWTAVCATDQKREILDASDFTYHRGYYFVLDEKQSRTWIIDPDSSRAVSVIPSVGWGRPFRSKHRYCSVPRRYLVESCHGEEVLFLVIAPSRTGRERFEVFELDQTEQQAKWSKVRSIGDLILFADSHRAMALPTTEFGGCRGNCIVFMDYDDDDKRFFFPPTRFSLFDIGNNRVERLPRRWDERMKGWGNQGWFLPSLR